MYSKGAVGFLLSSLILVNFGYSISLACRNHRALPIFSYLENLPKQTLTQQEINHLLYMREEEKLARDVYITLYRKWKLPIFRNIACAEQTHMDILGILIKKYKLEDPVINEVGVFKNPKLQNLYKKLVEQGEKSLVEALKVGATIEELDITDLKRALKETDNKDLEIAYTNLMKGSRNHLRAFSRILTRLGVQYKPKYLSVNEYKAIISSPWERGLKLPD